MNLFPVEAVDTDNLGAVRGLLLLVLMTADRFAEFLHPSPERAAEIREALRPEDDQHHQQDHEQVDGILEPAEHAASVEAIP